MQACGVLLKMTGAGESSDAEMGADVRVPVAGLSAAIPPSAYLMQQSQLQQHQQQLQLAGEKKPKREDANFGLVSPPPSIRNVAHLPLVFPVLFKHKHSDEDS